MRAGPHRLGCVTIPARLREYAETPDRFAYVPPGASVERFADERICILQGPTWASVSGASVGDDEVETVLAEVRTRVPADKEAVWWIGPAARPRDLYERLQALRLREPRDRVSLLHALVLAHAPSAPRAGIEVPPHRDVRKDFVAAREVQWDAFETPDTAERRTARASGRTSRSHSASKFRSASSRPSTAGGCHRA